MNNLYIIDDVVAILTPDAISMIAAWKSGLIKPGNPDDAKKLNEFLSLQKALPRWMPWATPL